VSLTISKLTDQLQPLIALLTNIPLPALTLTLSAVSLPGGFLLYMGWTSLESNAMFERILLLFTQRENYPPSSYVRRVPAAVTHAFTAVQVACFVVLWVVKSNAFLPTGGGDRGGGGGYGGEAFPIGLLFPVVLVSMIPFKLFVLPLIFSHPVLGAVAGASGDVDVDVLFY